MTMRKFAAAGVLAVVCLAGSSRGFAQAAPPVTLVAPATAYDEMLKGFEEECTAVAKAMPAEKYGFSPASLKVEGAKFDGVRTFAGELTHLISANYYFYGAVGKMKPTVDMKAIGALKSKDEILAALAASFTFAHQAIATLTPANAFEAIKPIDGISSRGGLAAFGVAHGFDHYGQMVEYLRMNGVLPPGSK